MHALLVCVLVFVTLAFAGTPTLDHIDADFRAMTFNELASIYAMQPITTPWGNALVYNASIGVSDAMGVGERYYGGSFGNNYTAWSLALCKDVIYISSPGSEILGVRPIIYNRTQALAYINTALPAVLRPFFSNYLTQISFKDNTWLNEADNAFTSTVSGLKYSSMNAGLKIVRYDPDEGQLCVGMNVDIISVPEATANNFAWVADQFPPNTVTPGIGYNASLLTPLPPLNTSSATPQIDRANDYEAVLRTADWALVRAHREASVPNGAQLIFTTSIPESTMRTAAERLLKRVGKNWNKFCDQLASDAVYFPQTRQTVLSRTSICANILAEVHSSGGVDDVRVLFYTIHGNVLNYATEWKWTVCQWYHHCTSFSYPRYTTLAYDGSKWTPIADTVDSASVAYVHEQVDALLCN